MHYGDKFMVKSLQKAPPPRGQFLFPGTVCCLLQKRKKNKKTKKQKKQTKKTNKTKQKKNKKKPNTTCIFFMIICLVNSIQLNSEVITKTCLYNVDPPKPHFYIVKLGFTGVYIIFLSFVKKHRLWVLVRTASPRRF